VLALALGVDDIEAHGSNNESIDNRQGLVTTKMMTMMSNFNKN